MRRRGGLPSLAGIAAVAAALVVGATAGYATTNVNTMNGTNVRGTASYGITATQFRRQCTKTINDIVNVSGTQTATGSNHLILGTSGVEAVTASAGNNCFIGGGPSSGGSYDTFDGKASTNDDCIVSTATPVGNIRKCTIVARAP